VDFRYFNLKTSQQKLDSKCHHGMSNDTNNNSSKGQTTIDIRNNHFHLHSLIITVEGKVLLLWKEPGISKKEINQHDEQHFCIAATADYSVDGTSLCRSFRNEKRITILSVAGQQEEGIW
jgi:hypothetical protein